jgi:hypothetical protein
VEELEPRVLFSEERDERRKKEGGDEATVARILDAVRSVSSVRKRRG